MLELTEGGRHGALPRQDFIEAPLPTAEMRELVADAIVSAAARAARSLSRAFVVYDVQGPTRCPTRTRFTPEGQHAQRALERLLFLSERVSALGINWQQLIEQDTPERIIDMFGLDRKAAEFGTRIVLDVVTRQVPTA
jgi:hypothetical protein